MSRCKLSWRRKARRQFKCSALCVGGWIFAAISSAAISQAANCGDPDCAVVWVYWIGV